MKVEIVGRVRQLLQALEQRSPGDEEVFGLSEQGELLVAIATSAYGETVRAGRAFEVHTTSAVAAVVAVPTTASLLQLYNNEPDDGRVMIIDRCWALVAAGTTGITEQTSLIGALGQTRVASPTAAALAINALNGLGGKDTRAIVGTGALDAVTGVAANWRVLSGQTGGIKFGSAASTAPGFWNNADVNGRIIVPPGRAFGIHVLGPVITTTVTVGIEWHEKNIKLG